jgi:hypothetical protein
MDGRLAVAVAIRRNAPLKSFYARLLANGKARMPALLGVGGSGAGMAPQRFHLLDEPPTLNHDWIRLIQS